MPAIKKSTKPRNCGMTNQTCRWASTISERLKAQKVPNDLLVALNNDGILVEIDGERPVEKIFKDIKAEIEKLQK